MSQAILRDFLKLLILIATYFLLLNPYILAPFYFGFITSKYLYILALTEIIIFFGIFLFLIEKPRFFKISPLLIFIIGFILVTCIASAKSINPILSFFGKFDRSTSTIFLLHIFGFLMVASALFKINQWQEFFLFSSIVGSSISLCLIGSYFGILDKYYLKSGVTFGNSSFLGTYLVFVFFFSLYFIFERNLPKKLLIFEENESRFIGFLGAFLAASALPLSGARAATLSTFSCLILIFIFYFCFRTKNKFNLLKKILLALVFLFILAFLVLYHWPQSIVQKMIIPYGMKARFLVWQGTWEAVKERPILGFGPETFELVYVRHFNPTLFLPEGGGEVRFDKAHNIIFDTLISSGILGLLFYLAIFAYAFYFLFNGFLKQKITFGTFSCFFALLLAYFLQNLTVFDTPPSYFYFFFTLGYLVSLNQKIALLPQKIKASKIVVAILFLFIFSFLFYYLPINQTRSSYLMAYISNENLFSKQRMAIFEKIEKLSLFGRYQTRERYALQVKDFFSEGKASKKEVDFALANFEKNIKEVPYDYYSMILLAKTYNYFGKEDSERLKRAEELLENAIKLSPKNLYAYWYLVENKILQGEYKEALSIANSAIQIEKRAFYSHLLYLKVLKKMGKEQLVEEKIKEIQKLFPEKTKEEIQKSIQKL